MARVDFYHLQNQILEDVLPRILEKAYESASKIVVRIGNEERVEFLNTHLWTYGDETFLPHGSKKDGNAELQPIWLTTEKENPNGAEMLFLVDGAKSDLEEIDSYKRVFNIFDGNSNDALETARGFWKEVKNSGAECFYWRQDEQGRWKQA